MAMVFQDPARSLNPTMRVGKQITEAIRTHRKVSKSDGRDQASNCSAWSASPRPSGGSASTRTSCPAACGSAS